MKQAHTVEKCDATNIHHDAMISKTFAHLQQVYGHNNITIQFEKAPIDNTASYTYLTAH